MNILKLEPCETCKGASMLIQTEGAMKGMIIPCEKCAGSWETYMKHYGTDTEDGHPEFYIDMSGTEGILEKIDKKKDYILYKGKEILLNP